MGIGFRVGALQERASSGRRSVGLLSKCNRVAHCRSLLAALALNRWAVTPYAAIYFKRSVTDPLVGPRQYALRS
jgi:hypothetical protein